MQVMPHRSDPVPGRLNEVRPSRPEQYGIMSVPTLDVIVSQ